MRAKTGFSLAIVMAILLFGCSKEEAIVENSTEELVQLTVDVAGVDEENAPEEIATGTSSGSISHETSAVGALASGLVKELSFEGFDAITLVENDGYESESLTTQQIILRSASGGSGNKMVTALPAGIRYRVLLYRSNGVFWNSQEATSGTALNIPVALGETYTWYAYSYNDNQTVADVADYNNPSIATGTTRDLITASGTVQIAATGSTHLAITFAHRTNRVGVELNTLGMFANLTNATLTLTGTNFTSGTFNLRTNAITGATAYTPAAVNIASFVRPINYTYTDRNIAYFYTANTAALPSLQVNLSNFSITLSNNTVRSFAGSTNYTFNVTQFASLGRSKTAVINLVESPVTVAGIQWARSNLYLLNNSTTAHNPYRFYPTNTNTYARESYWPWRGLTPADASVGSGDPCRQVYPTGRWRTPTPTELTTLSNTTTGRTFYPGNGNGSTTQTGVTLGSIQYTGTGTGAPSYPNSNLVIPYNGHAPNFSFLTGLVNLDFATEDYGRDAYLWTDAPEIALGTALGVDAQYYRAGQTPYLSVSFDLVISTQYNTASSTAMGSVTLANVAGLNAVSSGFQNVRCVRTTTANP